MVDGFFLNNQLTDFSFSPTTPNGAPAANAVAAGKRPRSSMAPTIVLDSDGGFVAGGGLAGRHRRSWPTTSRPWSGVLDWELPLQQAIDLPNLIARGDGAGAEVDLRPAVAEALKAAGWRCSPAGARSRTARSRGARAPALHGVEGVRGRGLSAQGGADPRREGAGARALASREPALGRLHRRHGDRRSGSRSSNTAPSAPVSASARSPPWPGPARGRWRGRGPCRPARPEPAKGWNRRSRASLGHAGAVVGDLSTA